MSRGYREWYSGLKFEVVLGNLGPGGFTWPSVASREEVVSLLNQFIKIDDGILGVVAVKLGEVNKTLLRLLVFV